VSAQLLRFSVNRHFFNIHFQIDLTRQRHFVQRRRHAAFRRIVHGVNASYTLRDLRILHN